MSKSRKAFTLVELLISVLVMFIIIGTVVTTGKVGIALFQKAEQNALVTNGLRMTVASFNREIAPKLDHAKLVEILADNSKLPDTLPTSFDNYLYMKDGAVFIWNTTKKEPLAGSEYISSLTFSVPVSSEDNYANYMVSMNIDAVHPDNENTKTSVSVSKALFNYKRTEKRGSVIGTAYTGSVLHFITSDTSVMASNLRILNSSKEVIDKGTVTGVKTISASYDITVSPLPAYEYKNVSAVVWYISEQSDAELNPDSDAALHELTQDNAERYYWQIVSADGTEISSHDITAGNKLYVKTESGVKEWGKYGYLRFAVTPSIRDINGTDELRGDPAKSEYVLLQQRKLGPSLWDIWTGTGTFDTGDGNFVKNTGANALTVIVDKDSGLKVILRGTKENNTSPSVILAKIQPEYLKDQKTLSVESDGKSYTTLTNCSIIVDADVETSDGYGILLNGSGIYTGKDADKIYDTGLMFQVAAKTDSFPMRLYSNGYQHKSANSRSWGTGDHGAAKLDPENDGAEKTIAYTSDTNTHKFTGHGRSSKTSSFYGPFYGPGYMKNSKFQYENNYYRTDNKTPTSLNGNVIVPQTPYTERRRIILTVLEYYMDNDKTRPYFIVRMKYLKLQDDGTYPSGTNENDDPLMIGPGWFLSEPIWYGGFVGQKPEKIGSKDYRFTIKNYSSYPTVKTFDVPEDKIKLTAAGSNPKNGEFYVTSVTKNGTDGTANRVNTLFEAAKIEMRGQITGTEFDKNNKRTAASELYASPKHDRYLGIRTWSNQNIAFETAVYNVELAPGFSKEELLAIMPKGAQMYEISDIGDEAPEGISQSNLGGSLFGGNIKSDGTGNGSGISDGVMGIQHVMGNCTCPMCKKYLKK